MDWITDQIMIGAWDEQPPQGARVLDLRSIADHCLIPDWAFQVSIDTIDSLTAKGGTVYVHCIGGISRSPTIVAAWLALRRGMDWREAIALVKAKRPQIQPHPEQLASLASFVGGSCKR